MLKVAAWLPVSVVTTGATGIVIASQSLIFDEYGVNPNFPTPKAPSVKEALLMKSKDDVIIDRLLVLCKASDDKIFETIFMSKANSDKWQAMFEKEIEISGRKHKIPTIDTTKEYSLDDIAPLLVNGSCTGWNSLMKEIKATSSQPTQKIATFASDVDALICSTGSTCTIKNFEFKDVGRKDSSNNQKIQNSKFADIRGHKYTNSGPSENNINYRIWYPNTITLGDKKPCTISQFCHWSQIVVS